MLAVGLWPTRSIKTPAGLLCGALLLCLLPLISTAQEPEENAESSAASSAASSSSKSSEAPLYPSRTMRNKSLFADEIKDEAQWLDTEHGKILALYRPTEAKKTLGVLILFHAAENPQFWPPMLENLRANLPRYGWETLAISLPHKYPAPIPARPSSSSFSASASSASGETEDNTEDAAPADETAAQEEAVAAASSSAPGSSSAASSSVAREVLIATYVEAAFGFLKEKGRFNVVVLTDNSSAHQVLQNLLPQVKENKRDASVVDGPLQALVITNLQQQEPISKTELEAIFSAAQLPVMDIFFAPDNAEQHDARELHRAIAMRKKLADYQQHLIDTQPKMVEQDHQSYLLGRVRGFMKQKASGSELTSNNPQ
ncbi:DUF3530 family protein [Cellvibrio sp. OA-2007]|uniref:DUF3530 family protein n=1 Tax=Cellvibrio sp. OA-2007 TaxID=529823 RepID=UPI0007817778|nr:DUF3530 family protein [Cellvibrio sp. OA-2007]